MASAIPAPRMPHRPARRPTARMRQGPCRSPRRWREQAHQHGAEDDLEQQPDTYPHREQEQPCRHRRAHGRMRASTSKGRQLDHRHQRIRGHPPVVVEDGPIGDAHRYVERPDDFKEQVGQAARPRSRPPPYRADPLRQRPRRPSYRPPRTFFRCRSGYGHQHIARGPYPSTAHSPTRPTSDPWPNVPPWPRSGQTSRVTATGVPHRSTRWPRRPRARGG